MLRWIINKLTDKPMYLCQPLCVCPSPLPLLSFSMSHQSSIDLCHPMLLYLISPLFPYCRYNSWFVFPWWMRGTEDGWEDGGQRDEERERCSFGLVHLISYVLLLPLATLHIMLSLTCRHT